MILTFLGTGTSQGIPVIACKCSVCKSADAKDKRLRTSALLQWPQTNFLIDIGPDFRQQALRSEIENLQAVLLTHEHADHTAGLDDIRPVNFKVGRIPFYGEARVLEDLKKRFHYVFEPHLYPGLPEIDLIELKANTQINIAGKMVEILRIWHGQLGIVGFKIGGLVYITDASRINDEQIKSMANCKVLVINALRKEEHHSHLNLSQAVRYINQINPDICYITHLSHQMGCHHFIERELPVHIKLAYDGLRININDE
ncbi:MAG: MBL fold metallo-hydrolase [Saprospiraceae bacterium]|nr:MBL fold metallo-hydrolase [Saprospiraceae bacterium]